MKYIRTYVQTQFSSGSSSGGGNGCNISASASANASSSDSGVVVVVLLVVVVVVIVVVVVVVVVVVIVVAVVAALVSHTQTALQCITSCFAESAQLFGLEVSLKKTEVLHQPAPQNEYHVPHISIGETVLKSVEQFTYLGCTISSNARIDGEIDNRLAKANSAFGRLYKRVWNNKHLRITTMISVYRAVVLTTLLYGSVSWVTYRNHLKLLERFYPHYPKHTLERLYHQHHSPGASRHHQHRGHVTEDPTALGRACCQDGRPSLAQDHFIWRTFFWPPKQRGAKEAL